MAYTPGNKCAKNCCKQTTLVELVVEDVVICFFNIVVFTITLADVRVLCKPVLVIIFSLSQ